MCGIAGYFSANKNYTVPLHAMTDRLRHRGPDADGFFTDDCVGLGHRRLSIIDLSEAANQPLFSADQRYTIIFNGEVFNFKEVGRQLRMPLRTHSDSEVMTEAFAKWGAACVEKFNGMFAFAIYDLKEKTLWLFRDRLGVKPLFYWKQNEEFFFASEIKALTEIDFIKSSLTINKEAVSLFLQLGYIPEPQTIYNEIKKFPAGQYLKISSTEFSWSSYWKPEQQITDEVESNPGHARKQLLDLLSSSVTYRMISDVPFGAFLSGGIDSSLVTALAQQHSALPLKTFTIGFKEEKYNEAVWAKKIASHLKTDHQEYVVTYEDAIELVEPMLDVFDEPFADSSALPTMLVSKQARKEVKMVLTGDGGDELFMGYGSYRWAMRLNNPLIKKFRKQISLVCSLLNERYQRAAHLFDYESENNLPAHIFSQEQYFFSEREAGNLLTVRPAPAALDLEITARKLSAAEKQALFDLRYYLRDDLLVKVDRASMHYGLECRTPFLDYRVVSFALNLSDQLKMKNGELKILPRMLLADLIPKELFERPKKGFAIPLSSWLRYELSFLFEKYLSDEVVLKHNVVRADVVSDLKKQFNRGKNYFYHRLWNLIVLHRWLEKNN